MRLASNNTKQIFTKINEVDRVKHCIYCLRAVSSIYQNILAYHRVLFLLCSTRRSSCYGTGVAGETWMWLKKIGLMRCFHVQLENPEKKTRVILIVRLCFKKVSSAQHRVAAHQLKPVLPEQDWPGLRRVSLAQMTLVRLHVSFLSTCYQDNLLLPCAL